MWDVISKATEHVSLYSTICGQAWYLFVLLFRLIVVASIGSSVYGDEQSSFRCSTEVIGCENVCYDRFAKISHMRFWAFQILALATPVVFFHFYGLFVEGRIEKLKDAEKHEADTEKADLDEKEPSSKWDIVREHVNTEIRRRRKQVGKVKQHKVYRKDKLKDVAFTRNILIAYFLSVVARLAIEILFLYLAFDMFRFAEYPDVPGRMGIVSDGRRVSNPFDLFWIRVPQLYRCTGKTVRWACEQHMLPGNLDSYVPCWISRPWEKTIFLRYMNTLSVICLLLCIGEIVQLLFRHCTTYKRKVRERRLINSRCRKAPSTDSNNKYVPTKAPVQAATDVLYTKDETMPGKQDKAPLRVSEPDSEEKQSSNALVDLATGRIDIKQLQKMLQDSESQIQPSTENSKTTEGFTKMSSVKNGLETPERKMKTDGPTPNRLPSSKPRSVIFTGTQSLNRPFKLTQGRHSTFFRLVNSDISHSDEMDDDDRSESESSDEADDGSVSNH